MYSAYVRFIPLKQLGINRHSQNNKDVRRRYS